MDNHTHLNLKHSTVLKISICILILVLSNSCVQTRKQKLINILGSKSGNEWYLTSADDSTPHYIYKFYSDGKSQKFYTNVKKRKLFRINSSNETNERWSVENDSIVNLFYSENNSGIEKYKNKVIYFSSDSILLQGDNSKSKYVFILTKK